MGGKTGSLGKNGAPGGIRTHDQLIKSQLLYQLSYRGNRTGTFYGRAKVDGKNYRWSLSLPRPT